MLCRSSMYKSLARHSASSSLAPGTVISCDTGSLANSWCESSTRAALASATSARLDVCTARLWVACGTVKPGFTGAEQYFIPLLHPSRGVFMHWSKCRSFLRRSNR